MVHYFNPGHETAVLNASKYYQPSRMIAKMQEDLALLPVWYAELEDYVFVGHQGTGCKKDVSKGIFIRHCEGEARSNLRKINTRYCFTPFAMTGKENERLLKEYKPKLKTI